MCDETGRYAAQGQPDDVWFLVGTFGGEARRECSVPIGRSIFFPVFNVFRVSFLMFGRKAPVTPHASGVASLDGEPLAVRTISNDTPFPMRASADCPFGIQGDAKVRAWGLWSSVDRISAGEHILKFRGEEEPGGFYVDVTYQLEIV